MILTTLKRWLWIMAAFCIASLVALAVLFLLGALWAGEGFRQVAEAQGDPILWQASDIFGALFFATAAGPALTAMPGLVAVVAGEILRVRTPLYYVAAGGAALAVIPFLAAPGHPGEQVLPAADYLTLFATAGFAGGFAYWLLAGRGA